MPVGIDIGATRVKLVSVDRSGRVVQRGSFATRPEDGIEALLDRLADWARATRPPPKRVGVGFCGMVDAERGVVLDTTDTMPGFGGLALAYELSQRLGIDVACDNDGNCAALGEARLGAGREARSMAMLTLGTGVGGGLVVDGELWRGAGFMAGKLGHMKVRSGGRRCACGARGCLEAQISAWAWRRADGRAPRAIFEAAEQGEEKARRLVDAGADALGAAFADLANTLNPELIVVGGGLAAGWPQLKPRALARYEARALPHAHRTTLVRRARLGSWSGALGAAML